MITDAHNHLQQLPAPTLDGTGVDRCTTCGTSPADWQSVLDLAAADPRITPAIGLHPWFITTTTDDWLELLATLLESNATCTVGEIGLDKTRHAPPLPDQLPVLISQLELAARLDRPATLHCVRAHGTLLDTLTDSPLPARGLLLHSYAGAPEMIPRYLALPVPVYLSLSSPDLIPHIPHDRLLLESDATRKNQRTPAHVHPLYHQPSIDPTQITTNYQNLFPQPAPLG
ncbi:MAG: TatD family hydrolase [Verrucomicrobiales bacterium]|nr:TatD family hydrolase [Verrucomicrobiales bacterium]